MISRAFVSDSNFSKILKHRLDFLKTLSFPPTPSSPITITYSNTHTIQGTSFQTSCLSLSQSLNLPPPLAAQVKYLRPRSSLLSPAEDELTTIDEMHLYDLSRPLEDDCEVSFIYFSDPLGKQIFWHSASHILGYALETLTSGLLCSGPATANGFYYDINVGSLSLTPTHLQSLSKLTEKIIKSNYDFERYVISKKQALELFRYNPHKLHFISSKVPENAETSVYRIGEFVDLCMGPHVLSTGTVKALHLTDTSAVHWLGKSENTPLQRVYGTAFPSASELSEHLQHISEIQKRDHRKIGASLYFWHPFSAGSTFFLAEGTRIYNRLIEFLRKEYLIRGFTEVISPNLYNIDLWKRSGHYYKYKSDMFILNSESSSKEAEEELGLKPMNCPGHCLIFDHSQKSYKELPLRLAEFGVLHRNEVTGSLSGLTRVRRFIQDDSHIFCRKDQIKAEVAGCLDFVDYVYGVFGFAYDLELSTRPDNALGSGEVWESAERQLEEALKENQKEFKVCRGEGAFYGPKIDIKVKDAMGRSHQCGTIQLDFNLPKRFNLQYKTEDTKYQCGDSLEKYEDFEENRVRQGFERPVIIHRAILGSLERIIAVLTEHYAGKWPFWMSPRQIIIVTIGESVEEYSEKFKNRLELEGFYADIDKTAGSLSKKIRNAQLAQYNYIGVIGKEEASAGTVDLRDRDTNKTLGKYGIGQLIELFKAQAPKVSKARKEKEDSAWGDR